MSAFTHMRTNKACILLGKEHFPTVAVIARLPTLECTIMLKLSTLALVVMIASPLAANAYTQEDADACTPDAMKLCQNAIPDAGRVTQCLVQNKRQLSPACAVVMSRPHDASTARDTPQNIQRTRY